MQWHVVKQKTSCFSGGQEAFCSVRTDCDERLRPGKDATSAVIIPFFLNDVPVSIPGDIGTGGVACSEDPGAFVTDLIAIVIVPGIQERIGCRLHLFVRGDVDRLIGIIVVWAAAWIAGETGSIGHRGINGV